MAQRTNIEVLVVDDDPDSLRSVVELLSGDGYSVRTAGGGREALLRIQRHPPDCLVLDYAMPELTGLEVVRTLREAGQQLPVVMLSTKGDSYDRVAGYGSGADIYVGKQEDPAVLRAAVRRLLQQRRKVPETIETGGLFLDLETWRCAVDGRPVSLPPRLFSLLQVLASQPGRVLRKEQLILQVWGSTSDVYNRAVDNAVADLRRCLGDDHSAPRFIHTVRGIGYKFQVTE